MAEKPGLDLKLQPLLFFRFKTSILKTENGELTEKHLLPNTSQVSGEEPFCKIYLGWNDLGIYVRAILPEGPYILSAQNPQRNDCIELFFDTRDNKEVEHTTRFCHHFFLLPEAVQGVQCGEMTHFRGDESHPLATPADLSVSQKTKGKENIVNLFIPSGCLHGFDPQSFQRLGFTYTVSLSQHGKQQFSLPDSLKIEDVPHLWASLSLK